MGRRGKDRDGQRRQGPPGPHGDAPSSREGQGRGSRQGQVVRNLNDQFSGVAVGGTRQQGKRIQILVRRPSEAGVQLPEGWWTRRSIMQQSYLWHNMHKSWLVVSETQSTCGGTGKRTAKSWGAWTDLSQLSAWIFVRGVLCDFVFLGVCVCVTLTGIVFCDQQCIVRCHTMMKKCVVGGRNACGKKKYRQTHALVLSRYRKVELWPQAK